MVILTLFAFLAGIVTILSPCILPILPIVLSGSIDQGRRKPLGIIFGFITSFTFFTLFLSLIVSITNLSADVLRNISVVILLIFGFSLITPQFQIFIERLFSKFSRFGLKGSKSGFIGGVLIGLSLGLVWTPCVGPILASVITLAATNEVTTSAAIITFAYALGTAIPMLLFMYLGRKVFAMVPWLLPNSKKFQQVFGALMIIVAIALYFNLHRSFQAYVLEIFPNYGTILTQLEENTVVETEINKLRSE